MGMKGGFSTDFTTPKADGYVWNFNLRECGQRAFGMIREKGPYTIIGSPGRTPFSNIQNLNMRTDEARRKVKEARQKGTKHL